MSRKAREDSESGRSSTARRMEMVQRWTKSRVARDRDDSERLYKKTREAWAREDTEQRSEEGRGGNRYGRDQKGWRWFGG
jgi:hypothetical protein